MKTARIFFRPIAAFQRTMSKGERTEQKGGLYEQRASSIVCAPHWIFVVLDMALFGRRIAVANFWTAFSALGDSFRDS